MWFLTRQSLPSSWSCAESQLEWRWCFIGYPEALRYKEGELLSCKDARHSRQERVWREQLYIDRTWGSFSPVDSSALGSNPGPSQEQETHKNHRIQGLLSDYSSKFLALGLGREALSLLALLFCVCSVQGFALFPQFNLNHTFSPRISKQIICILYFTTWQWFLEIIYFYRLTSGSQRIIHLAKAVLCFLYVQFCFKAF